MKEQSKSLIFVCSRYIRTEKAPSKLYPTSRLFTAIACVCFYHICIYIERERERQRERETERLKDRDRERQRERDVLVCFDRK